MFKSIEDFKSEWSYETAATQRLMAALTDESLHQRVTPHNRSLGQLASHLTTSPHGMLTRTGLAFDCPIGYDDIPESAEAIAEAYRKASQAMLDVVSSQWTDASLTELHDMYGQQWPNALTLRMMIQHEVHHRGQMTVLMRQAGLRIPGMYGPTVEEWAGMGMEPPVV